MTDITTITPGTSPSITSFKEWIANDEEMYVIKRNNTEEIVSFNKILKRIKTIGEGANIKINYTALTMKIIDQLFNKITT